MPLERTQRGSSGIYHKTIKPLTLKGPRNWFQRAAVVAMQMNVGIPSDATIFGDEVERIFLRTWSDVAIMQIKLGNWSDATGFGNEIGLGNWSALIFGYKSEWIFLGNWSDVAIFGERVEGIFVVAG